MKLNWKDGGKGKYEPVVCASFGNDEGQWRIGIYFNNSFEVGKQFFYEIGLNGCDVAVENVFFATKEKAIEAAETLLQSFIDPAFP